MNRLNEPWPCIESLESRTLLAGTGVGGIPQPDHVVIVVEENHSYQGLFGTSSGGSKLPGAIRPPKMPFIQSLAKNGALFTNSHGITHPSQPNYLALFSGSTQHVSDDSYVRPDLAGPDLGGELISGGKTFTGYAEDLKRIGFTGDKSAGYRKKHNPWADFTDVPAADNQPLTALPKDFSQLPTLSFVIPTDAHNMHSGSATTADGWLKKRLGAYGTWAQSHNSLLIVTWDEDDGSSGNQIATIFYGPMVKPGKYNEHVTHYNVLRTLEDMYRLGYAGASATAAPITDVWAAG